MSSPTSPTGSTPALWRVNTELRERNAQLETELRHLQQETARRRSTVSAQASSLSSGASLTSAGSSIAAELAGSSQAAAASAAAQERLTVLEGQLVERQTAAQAACAAAAAAADAAEASRAEAAVAQAGIVALSSQLAGAKREAEELAGQLDAERQQQAAKESKATARLKALEAQVDALLREAKRRDVEHQRQQRPQGVRAGKAGTAFSRASSPATDECEADAGAHHSTSPLPALQDPSERHATRVYNVVLPVSGGDAEAAAERAVLEEEVARLRDRLAAVEAELAAQLAAKQEAQQLLSSQQAEVAALLQERELLQEQAVSLQQEVSAWQQGRAQSPAEGEPALERSPSKTLMRRMREMLSPKQCGSSLSRTASAQSKSPRGSPGVSRSSPGGDSCGNRRASPGVTTAEQEQHAVVELPASGVAAAGGTAAVAAGAGFVVGTAVPETADGAEHKQCRAVIESVYAQMWRERLGRQRAQAETVDLRLRLSSQLATAGVGGTSGADADLDDAVLASLEQEMKRADHYADELGRFKAQQVRLQQRVEGLELQLAGHNSLLATVQGTPAAEADTAAVAAAAATKISPRKPGPASSPARASPASSRLVGATTTARGATSPMQGRRAGKEAAALKEELKVAQAEVASVHRRERESLAARRKLEGQQAQLVSGLHTLQRLLMRRSQGQGGSSRCSSMCGSVRSPARLAGTEGGGGATSGGSGALLDGAMAALSALLREVQPEEAGDSQAVLSPRASDAGSAEDRREAAASCGSVTEEGVLSAPLSLPQAGGWEDRQTDPLDVCLLLPDGNDGGTCGLEACSMLVHAPPVLAAVARAEPEPSSMAGGMQLAQDASPEPACQKATASCSSASQEAGEPGTIPAVRPKDASTAVPSLQATCSFRRLSASRIPAAPPALPAGSTAKHGSATAGSSPSSKGSPGKCGKGSPSKGLGLRKLLQASCSRLSPRATVSNTGDGSGDAKASQPALVAAPPPKARRSLSPLKLSARFGSGGT